LFRKGASNTSAMAIEIASTNLVIELGILLALLIGWQFTAAEFVGGPIMIILLAVLFRIFLRQKLVEEARTQADKGVAGSMEGHAAMDMSIQQSGSLLRRLRSPQAATSVSHIFFMEWAAVVRDIVIGLLIAGAVAAWVPNSFWQHLFLTSDPTWAKVWGPIIGPVVSILASCAPSATCHSPGCCGTAGSASEVWSRSSSPTCSSSRYWSSTASITASR
jgi:uncharacterized membrane protein YraQ (UPF0718 family)